MSRRIPDEIMKIYTQYAGENINGKEIDALHAIEKEINLNFDRQSNFSYLSFISEFYRITCNHAHNVSHYKSENKIDTIGFICEIDVFDDTFMWNVMRNGNPCKQRIIPIPMTNCIWSLIHELLSCSIIDFFVIEVVPALYQEVVSKNIKSACYTKGHQPHVLFDSFAYYHQNISCTLRLEVDKNENNPT